MNDLTQLQRDRNWFVLFGVALLFGLFWTIFAHSGGSIVYTTVSFILFLHSGITMDLRSHHAEHDTDGHG